MNDQECKEMYFCSISPAYVEVATKKQLLKQVVKNAKGKKSGFYKLKKNQLRAILSKQ
jgi:hypothetical protein